MPSEPAHDLRRLAKFEASQRMYFEEPNTPRFLWQTHQPYVAEHERALLPRIDPGAANPFLEVGCGEGANLYHLSRDAAASGKMWVGADLFFTKVLHAARRVGTARAVCAKGQQLPFRDARFSHVSPAISSTTYTRRMFSWPSSGESARRGDHHAHRGERPQPHHLAVRTPAPR